LAGRDRYVRYARPSEGGTPSWGRVSNAWIEPLSGAPWHEGARVSGPPIDMRDVTLAPPAEPTKIVALGYNYRDLFLDPEALADSKEPHYSDPGFEPVIFLKGPNTLVAHLEPIRLPGGFEEVWVEVEIAAVIGKRARDLACRDQARTAVFGVTIANDVSAANIFNRDWHLARSKSLDTFCPLGPTLVQGVDDYPLRMRTRINGVETQSGSSDNRVLNTLDTVVYLSRLMTLEPGDLVLTGTPRGARSSLVADGDWVELEVDYLGTLATPVGSAGSRSGEAGHASRADSAISPRATEAGHG
jgi:2-keto-4-pentenoate hydratase/2-oxohepta-3-ene-1,7-dioic acid hydratase in catechol pathway